MLDTPINIASVNMRRRNVITHALLNSSPVDQVILIQEPWYDRIGTTRNDNERDGAAVRGGVSSPGWEIHYPATDNNKRAKVMAYTRKRAWEGINLPAHFTATSRLDLYAHPCVMILDLRFDGRTWRIVNFYNDVKDRSALDTLLSLELDPTVPTLVTGDFNTHSRSWSPEGITPSPWAERVEEWAVGNLLVLTNEPGMITRRGANHERSSTIDLTWYNDAAIEDTVFSNWILDWEGSLGSDHALTRVQGSLLRPTQPRQEDTGELGYVIDETKASEWRQQFKNIVGSPDKLPAKPTAAQVDIMASRVHEAMQQVTAAVMKPRKPFHPKGAPWWNADCAETAEALRMAETTDDRQRQSARLRAAARKAKWKWADDVIGKSNLWEVATWQHGRRMNKIPPLRTEEGLSHAHADIANVLSNRFFVRAPPEVPTRLEDDPPTKETRALPAFSDDLIENLLTNTSNLSSPGASGQTHPVIRSVSNSGVLDHAHLIILHVCAGHHPLIWRQAIVCAVPKPHRADYSLAKNFRPVSLMECMGKLVEKLMARLIYSEIIRFDLLPTNQFGGRMASSTLDAGLTLTHDIQVAHTAGLRTGLLLFDIQGYFDNINRERLTQLVEDLGFAQEITLWTRAFLSERTVRLKFNNNMSDPFSLEVGTPQGSPISPVLSSLYTHALLRMARDTKWTALYLYIDDGAILACGKTWPEVESSLIKAYSSCASWLVRSGLKAEPDKTELMFFRRRQEKTDPPGHILLPQLPLPTSYKVTAAHRLRYLGFFLDHKLRWEHHVNVMCNRARASIRALQLLGNSVRGLDFAQWRLAYNAICLPVLTYGCQLWYTGKQKGLVQKLQVVQNEGIRLLAGAFRTTPREPLQHLFNILPMDLRLRMITDNVALRLYRLQRSSQVLLRLGGAWAPDPGEPIPTPARKAAKTALRAMANRISARGNRVEAFPELPEGAPHWNGKVSALPPVPREGQTAHTTHLLRQRTEGKTPQIFMTGILSNKGRHDDISVAATAATLYHKQTEWGHTESILGDKLTQADAENEALRSALALLGDFVKDTNYEGPIQLITGTPTALSHFINFSQHATQHASVEFAWKIDSLLKTHPQITISLQAAKRSPELVGFKRTRHLALEAVKRPLPNEQRPPSIHYQRAVTRAEAIGAWERRYQTSPRQSQAYDSTLIAPPDGRAHLVLWIASTGVRRKGRTYFHRVPREVQSTLTRLITGHAFTGAYRLKFQRKNLPPATEEEVACACGAVPEDTEHVLLHCPLTHDQRLRHLSEGGLPDSLRKIFDSPKRCLGLLRFLEETRICAKPQIAWEPG